ncbi:hypothetical protein [Enterobacter hormaechei]|uniref:hypothetical protein n=1 Tax=Enterobacter hormaechei TaxID=158836 RepID=UPI0029DB4B61|nr:hypothetical protein [Enterobacter hormaechei]MDX7122041.1 hypothetical protein [Enterobacter hormaechei]
MKRLLVAGLLLASFGAAAGESVYHCTDMNGAKETFYNGVGSNGEYVRVHGDGYFHSGTTEDGASAFTQDEQHKLYVHWVNDKTTIITVFSPVKPMINEYQCNSPTE